MRRLEMLQAGACLAVCRRHVADHAAYSMVCEERCAVCPSLDDPNTVVGELLKLFDGFSA